MADQHICTTIDIDSDTKGLLDELSNRTGTDEEIEELLEALNNRIQEFKAEAEQLEEELAKKTALIKLCTDELMGA